MSPCSSWWEADRQGAGAVAELTSLPTGSRQTLGLAWATPKDIPPNPSPTVPLHGDRHLNV